MSWSTATTAGQTIGPFFGYALPYDQGENLVPPGHRGAIRLHGAVFDGHSMPVSDALVEVWQADERGNVVQRPGSLRRDGWTFTGWGRAATDTTGHYSFTTLPPGPVAGSGAPFFAITLFARGLTDRLFTRAYLPAAGPRESAAQAADSFLSSVPEARRHTLIAVPEQDGLRFDIHLQGGDETVFLRYQAS